MNFFQWLQNAVFTAHHVLISREGNGRDAVLVCENMKAKSVWFCKFCYFQNLTHQDITDIKFCDFSQIHNMIREVCEGKSATAYKWLVDTSQAGSAVTAGWLTQHIMT